MARKKVNLGKCLLSYRLAERGLSQQDLADKLGTTRQQINDWSSGRKKMSLPTAKLVADELNTTIDSLYEWIIIRK